MTLEEFYNARALDTDKFLRRIGNDPDFEREYYDWVDYLTVTSIQDKIDLKSTSRLASDYKRSYEMEKD